MDQPPSFHDNLQVRLPGGIDARYRSQHVPGLADGAAQFLGHPAVLHIAADLDQPLHVVGVVVGCEEAIPNLGVGDLGLLLRIRPVRSLPRGVQAASLSPARASRLSVAARTSSRISF